MPNIRFNISTRYRKELEHQLRTAQRLGNLRHVKYLLAILAVMEGRNFAHVACVLKLSVKTLHEWVRRFLCYGPKGAPRRTSPGRPSKLTKTQKEELARLIEAGPSAAGYGAGAWRTPLVQQLILKHFHVLYNVFYLAQLLKGPGFSWQKAKFVSDHLDGAKRQAWREQTWSHILNLARRRGSLLFFGDEVSFPQWGTLSYTWARRGQQPVVKTGGKRTGYKVFGLIDYFTGRFFHQGHERRLNSTSYTNFLAGVLEQTRQPIILIQDGARYHTSAETKEFFQAHAKRLEVFQLPTYSPDYNPIEKLWKKIKQQETHLHYFPTFDALKVKVEQALVRFANAPQEILALCGLPAELALAA